MTDAVSERERWEAERRDKDRELAIAEREIALKEQEALRQKRGDAWKNPLVLAIMTAALAAAGNGVVSYVGARQQTLLEASKAESARILEMIKTGDTEQAARNLSFLADTGLVTSDDVRQKLARFLQNRTPENSPRLPSSTTAEPAFLSQQEKQELLGGPQVHATGDANEAISLDDPWILENIVEVEIPQLSRISQPLDGGRIRFHKAAALALKHVFDEIEQTGLLGDVLTFDSAFVPRTVRGSLNRLSAHALGIAVDLNAGWNGYGTVAPSGKQGSVSRIVPIFQKHGFVWGGTFSRPDAMHFEFADREVLTK